MPEEEQILEKKYVAAITTSSLKEILNLFPYNSDDMKFLITKIRANASRGEKETPMIEDPSLGITGYLDKRKDAFYMDYNATFDENGKIKNPINRAAITKIISDLGKLGLEDAAVDEVQLMIKDKELGEVAGNNEELFSMTLVSDPVDSEMDRKKVLTKSKHQQSPFIQWEGDTFYSLRAQPSVVQKVKEYFKPYSLMKVYGSGTEDTLVLLDVSR